ncbi:uncharacterized protein LOC134206834 [Armigeres subalbatus]|uniref:uncharacterized protein LOC134206834 n=1 Tax=Armigeres subalbatus TaxID=124917 RepID=UPI002ED49595
MQIRVTRTELRCTCVYAYHYLLFCSVPARPEPNWSARCFGDCGCIALELTVDFTLVQWYGATLLCSKVGLKHIEGSSCNRSVVAPGESGKRKPNQFFAIPIHLNNRRQRVAIGSLDVTNLKASCPPITTIPTNRFNIDLQTDIFFDNFFWFNETETFSNPRIICRASYKQWNEGEFENFTIEKVGLCNQRSAMKTPNASQSNTRTLEYSPLPCWVRRRHRTHKVA